MPLLLLIPLIVVVVLTLWAILLPFSLWARYSAGRARRRAQPWVISVNAWLLAVSVLIFITTAALAAWWMEHALRDAAIGLLTGCALGALGLWTTRFEGTGTSIHYTPNRWVVVGLTAVIAIRLGLGLWLTWQHLAGSSGGSVSAIVKAGGWMGVAGLLFGYHLVYAWGLRAKVRNIA